MHAVFSPPPPPPLPPPHVLPPAYTFPPFSFSSLLLLFRFSSSVFVSVTLGVIIIDRFYIALFSALEQTHCARM